jgi:hypothetical protein
MHAGELILVQCPCRCRSPLVFPKVRAGSAVQCPNTARRVRLTRWQVFGRRQWDDCRVLPVLRRALTLLRVDPSERKRRLLAVAVGRGCLDWCNNLHFAHALSFAERVVEGGPDVYLASPVLNGLLGSYLASGRFPPRADHWQTVAVRCLEQSPDLDYGPLEATYGAGVWAAFKDIIPNPFHTPAIDPSLRTSAVLGLAETAYTERAFDVLPILADALEEEGCNERGLLDHLRGPGPHHRGCWALDAVLGNV